jgi:hydrophobe/amphiphile efflux-3 (HAE3) family protein
MALVGAPLTMASVAVLPVLIGLAVDYAIQLQARFAEEERPGRDPARAAVAAAGSGAPTIATAAGATAAGFLVLQLSPVPMVRGFGLLLVAGVAVAFVCALTAGFAALVVLRRGASGLPRPLRSPGRALGAAVRGAGELLGAVAAWLRGALVALGVVRRGVGAVRRGARASLAFSLRRPGTVLAVAAAVAVVGWVAGTQTRVVSDVPRLVPQDTRSLRDLEALQSSTGVAGEVDVLVQADDVTRPAVVGWMADYQRQVLSRYGYSRTRPCGTATLCPSLSLPDLLAGAASHSSDARRIRAILDAVPPYFSRAVITGDRRAATLAFGIRLMPLDQQQRVLDDLRSRLDPPTGVTARLAGLPVLAAQANADVSSGWRRALTLVAGLLAVLAVLLLVWRRLERALVPLLPIVLATGWAAGVLVLVGVPLNPLSVTLGALVVAIATEFSVLLSERYRQERAAGGAMAEALRATYRSTGAAVLASGTTAIAGFAVLVLSDIRMVRDFGLVTVIDLFVALAGVLLVLPAVIVLSERGELLGLPRLAARRAWEARPRPRRSRAPA